VGRVVDDPLELLKKTRRDHRATKTVANRVRIGLGLRLRFARNVQRLCRFIIFGHLSQKPLDKLELIIREKQAELLGLQAELNEALTGVESPDYKRAGRLQPLVYRMEGEITRLENFRTVRPVKHDFQSYLSRLVTDDSVTTLELWTHIQDHHNDVTTRVLEIRKGKTGRRISCTLRFEEAAQVHLHERYTIAELQHIGWTAGRRGKTFYYKTRLRSPDEFDRFCQFLSLTLLEPLFSLWRHGQQYYRFQ
jgi:hypothetical protein